MHLTVIGTGYVGLVTGACFSEMGNHVTCVDVDSEKIEKLKKGIIPIYEPGLEDIVIRNHKSGLLSFTTSLEEAMKTSNIYFIAVGTPPGEDGSADLKYVIEVAREIGLNMSEYSVVVDKSTVPVGTGEKVSAVIQEILSERGLSIDFDVVSNPEFLKEGAAVQDFMRPDRIILGTDSTRAREILSKLYSPFSRNHDKTIFMGLRDAEMTKYAANCMLATKISFMNEIACICEKLGADVENVRKGIGSDSRIGYSFIYPGCGYGGSCFPKDIKALIRTSNDIGFDSVVLDAVEKRNNLQKNRLFEKAMKYFGEDLKGKTFAIWGLSFKPGTDDMREASSLVLISRLIEAGANVRAYDPVAMRQAEIELNREWIESGRVIMAEHQYDALKNADAMFLVTEWKPFRQPDFIAMKKIMKKPLIFDGRNQYEPLEIKNLGFEYEGIGRK